MLQPNDRVQRRSDAVSVPDEHVDVAVRSEIRADCRAEEVQRGKLVRPSQLSQAMSGRKLDCSMRFVEGPAVLQAMAAPIGKGAVETAV